MLTLASLIVACVPATGVGQASVPGVVVYHHPAKTKQYIGSPSLAVLPGGDYLASHDFFGPGSTRDRTVVYHSSDRGQTWSKRAEMTGQWWSTLFVHQGALYIMGTSKEYGFAVIRKSSDGGKTWTTPADKNTGLLLADAKYHCAPVPVTVHDGRLWRAMEDAEGPGKWGSHFRSFMMSAPVDADLLKAESWTSSNRLARDPDWLDGKFGGWLEGNAVVTPQGRLVNILRTEHRPAGNKAALITYSADGKTASFDPKTGFIDFPGGNCKFNIRFDPKTKLYWSLVSRILDKHKSDKPGLVRNTLALVSSPDLRHWTVKTNLLYHPDTLKHGFQYVDWLFEGTDVIALSRTAHDDKEGDAHNQHDANYLTFHRFANFRTLTMKDGVQVE